MTFLTSLVNDNPNYFRDSYISPKSPIELYPPIWNEIPVIDLAERGDSLSAATRSLVKQIKRACELYGMFKVSNHGISDEIMTSSMRSAAEFFYLSPENVAEHQTITNEKMLYTTCVAQAHGLENNPRYWRDNMQLAWNTREDAQDWPNRPYSFRTNLWNLGERISTLEDRLVKLISEGLELDDDQYFDRGLRRNSYVLVNQFPRCSRPEMAFGLPEHCDPGILMISLLGDVPGTQIWEGGEWKQVAPCMNTLLVTVGHQLQVVSNGIFKAPIHREVVNSQRARSIVF